MHSRRKISSCGRRVNAKRWSREDDARMLAAIEEYGCSCWKKIAKEVKTKSHHACYQRWRRSLDPEIRKDCFSPEELRSLAHAVGLHGTKRWSRVATYLPNRSDVQCKSRWKLVEQGSTKEDEELRMIASGMHDMKQEMDCAPSLLGEPRERFMSHSVPDLRHKSPPKYEYEKATSGSSPGVGLMTMDICFSGVPVQQTMLKLDVDALVRECEINGIQSDCAQDQEYRGQVHPHPASTLSVALGHQKSICPLSSSQPQGTILTSPFHIHI
eukprot:TRINITY_DN2325_c0_g1_i2.p1 TRINITY_DN2325_c0_g1~~TRINITY_DN2325_c0_g1_i2.p1  ORF type:complete len:270 (+),score=61.60 TRINITY_DN2325_c0_g1_i2:236-1045(+)